MLWGGAFLSPFTNPDSEKFNALLIVTARSRDLELWTAKRKASHLHSFCTMAAYFLWLSEGACVGLSLEACMYIDYHIVIFLRRFTLRRV